MEWTTISVTLSLLAGLALTRLLSGLVSIFRARRRAKVDWLPLVWIGVTILTILESWTALNQLPRLGGAFSFTEYLLLGGFMMLLFVASALQVPPGEIEAGESLRTYFDREGRFALPVFSAYLAAGALMNVTLFGGSFASTWFVLDVPLIILPVVVFAVRRPVQVLVTVVYLPLFAADVAISVASG